MYCTYLITYFGNKLPPFYIGSTSLAKIQKGYFGSVCSKNYKDIWYDELHNNKHLFKIRIVSTHTDRLSAYKKEELLQRHLKVMNNSLYINRSYAITGRDTYGINNPMYGKKRPDVSLNMKINNPMKNDNTKLKMSNTKKLLNKPAHNKGIPNPSQRLKMQTNNPMKTLEVSLKMTQSRLKNNGCIDPVKNTIWVANIVLKIRRRVTSQEFDLLDSSWIKLSNRLEIPNQEQAIHSDFAACTPARV